MIIYDSKIARLLQGRLNPYDYVTLPLVTLTALLWRERHLGRDGDEHPPPAIHGMFLCVPAAVPAFGWQVCWGFAALPLFAYYLLYWLNAWLSAIQRLITRQKKRARK